MKKQILVFLLCAILLLGGEIIAYAEASYDNIIEGEGTYLEGTRKIPKSYELTNILSMFESMPEGQNMDLSSPKDLFMGEDGYLYVVDSGNNRIIKMTTLGMVDRVFTGPDFTGVTNVSQEEQAANDIGFKSPEGVYVSPDGDIFVADTGNARIVHLSPQGRYIEQFTKPQSDLLASDMTFEINKVFVSNTNFIYVLKGRYFMMIDPYGNFRGFVGQQHVGFDLLTFLLRIFASQEQMKFYSQQQPSTYSNFMIHSDGMVYATVGLRENNEPALQRISSIGKNLMKDKDYARAWVRPSDIDSSATFKSDDYFVNDVHVNQNGIITISEQKYGMIYQYDMEGNNLCAFGGKEQLKGYFGAISSITMDKAGNLYALDESYNNIQVFSPTKFINLVHDAVQKYYEGQYDEAELLWNDVLKLDSGYEMAHKGLGKAMHKREEWENAMNEYLLAYNKEGYSLAFSEYRKEQFRQYFFLLILVVIPIYGLYRLLVFCNSKSKLYLRRFQGLPDEVEE